MTQQEVKAYVDRIVVEEHVEKQFSILGSLMDSLVPYMLQGYKECWEITQVPIGQLERIPSVCVPYFFMNCCHLIDNLQVKTAVFKANMKVKEMFIAPSAWACLHLYGNLYTPGADEPRLIIEMKEKE